MKRPIVLLTLLVFILFAGFWAYMNSPIVKKGNYRVVKENEEKNQEQRAEYFEFMNTGGADFDWKKVYAEQRREKAEVRMARQNRTVRSGGTLPSQEVFGNGALAGTWKERGANNQAGRIVASDMVESKDLIVFGSDGGTVFVGPIEGNEYEILNDHMQFTITSIHSFEMDNGTVRIAVVDKDGVYYTDDMGQTWENSFTKSLQQGIISRANDMFYIMDKSGGLYESSDMGETFGSIGSVPVKTNTSGSAYTGLWTARYSETPLYIQSANEVYTYSNGTLSKKGTVDAAVTNPTKLALTGNDDASLLFSTMTKKLYKSTDGGVSWTKLGDAPISLFGIWTIQNNFHYASYDDVLYFGGGTMFRSSDQGASWTEVHSYGQYDIDRINYPHVDHCDTKSYRDSKGTPFTLLSNDGGCHITYDNKSYLNITLSGMTNSQYYGTLTRWDDPDYILAGAQDQGAQLSMPDSSDTDILNFKLFRGGDDGSFTSSDSGKSAWFTYQGGALYYHPDTRTPLAYRGGQPNGGGGFIFMAPTMADPDNPKKVYIGGNEIYYMTYNGPNSFSSGTHSTGSFDYSLTALACSPIDNSYWYATNRKGAFYYSSDRGINWNSVPGGPSGGNSKVGLGIVGDPNRLGRVYVGGNGNGGPSVFVSDNHGQGFTELSNSPRTTVTKLAITPDSKYIFASTVTGPYVYIADEDEWFDLAGNSAPDNMYLSVEYIPTPSDTSKRGIARFGTYGRGIWDFNIEEVKFEPIEAKISTVSKNVAIGVQNRNLSISMPTSEQVSLKLFTMNGRLVVNEQRELAAGMNQVNLNTYNLSSGFYLTSIEYGTQKVVQKISIR